VPLRCRPPPPLLRDLQARAIMTCCLQLVRADEAMLAATGQTVWLNADVLPGPGKGEEWRGRARVHSTHTAYRAADSPTALLSRSVKITHFQLLLCVACL